MGIQSQVEEKDDQATPGKVLNLLVSPVSEAQSDKADFSKCLLTLTTVKNTNTHNTRHTENKAEPTTKWEG